VSKAPTITLCPQCNSSNVFYEMGGITGAIYHCRECDYIGPVIIERELTDEEIEAYERRKRAEDELRKKEKMEKGRKGRSFFRRT
jgi:regulator of RNase E activity RraA